MRVSLVYNRKGKTNKKGLALIQLRVHLKKSSKFFSTGIHILPRQWKKDKIVDHPNAQELNVKIRKMVSDLESHAIQLENAGQAITPITIEKFFKYKNLTCFFEFCENELSQDNSIIKTTKSAHKVTLNYLKEKFPQLTFSDLTYTTIHAFHNFLLGKGLGTNTIHGHHRKLKRYVHLAIKKELIEEARNPYKQFKAKTAPTKRDTLSPEEIASFENLELPANKANLELARDMFLMSCYTGLRFSDIIGMQKDDIITQGGKTTLKLKAQKTGKTIDLPLHVLHAGKPGRLVKKYMDDYKKTAVFPTITNQYANRCLREIAELLGIHKRVTTHVARHTFATHLAMKIKPALLQELLQHSNIATTMIYVHISEKMMLEELKKVDW